MQAMHSVNSAYLLTLMVQIENIYQVCTTVVWVLNFTPSLLLVAEEIRAFGEGEKVIQCFSFIMYVYC